MALTKLSSASFIGMIMIFFPKNLRTILPSFQPTLAMSLKIKTSQPILECYKGSIFILCCENINDISSLWTRREFAWFLHAKIHWMLSWIPYLKKFYSFLSLNFLPPSPNPNFCCPYLIEFDAKSYGASTSTQGDMLKTGELLWHAHLTTSEIVNVAVLLSRNWSVYLLLKLFCCV